MQCIPFFDFRSRFHLRVAGIISLSHSLSVSWSWFLSLDFILFIYLSIIHFGNLFFITIFRTDLWSAQTLWYCVFNELYLCYIKKELIRSLLVRIVLCVGVHFCCFFCTFANEKFASNHLLFISENSDWQKCSSLSFRFIQN